MSYTLNLVAPSRRCNSYLRIAVSLTLLHAFLASPMSTIAGHIRDEGSTEPWYAAADLPASSSQALRTATPAPTVEEIDGLAAILSEPVSVTGPINPLGLPQEVAALDLSSYETLDAATRSSSLPSLALAMVNFPATEPSLPFAANQANPPAVVAAWVRGGPTGTIAAHPSLASAQWGPLPLIALVLALLVTGNYIYRTLDRTRSASPLVHH